MKRIYLLLSLVVTAFSSFAQTPTNIIQNTGPVGIGTLTPLSLLDVKGGLAVGTFAGSAAAPANGLSVSGKASFGISAPTPISSAAPMFPSVTPNMEILTGITGGTYEELMTIRHTGIDPTLVTRRLGLLFKVSSETTAVESLKNGGMVLESSAAYANNPSLSLVTASTDRLTISYGGLVGIGTAAPTHALTLPSPSTGIAAYNTADQTTNYERMAMGWNSNMYDIGTYTGGAGVSRSLRLGVQQTAGLTALGGGRILTFNMGASVSSGNFDFNIGGTGAVGSIMTLNGSLQQATSGQQTEFSIQPTIVQAGTSAYTALLIAPFESTVGSGSKYLIDAGKNSAANGTGTHTSKFTVDDNGIVNIANRLTIGSLSGQGSQIAAVSGFATSGAFGTAGFGLQIGSETFTSTSSSGTIALQGTNTFGTPTLAASTATTLTNASTLYIAGAPVAGANVSITNPYALYVNAGNSYLNGSVGIGTTNTYTYKLAVNGSAIATEMWVKAIGDWPDFVFNKSYQLPALTDIKTYIDKNHHLPNVPTEQDVKQNGQNLGEMNKVLLQKVEELTLYMIEKDKSEREEKEEVKSQSELLKKTANANRFTEQPDCCACKID